MVLGCFSYHHCTMTIEYAWFRKWITLQSVVFVDEPGEYHCIVTSAIKSIILPPEYQDGSYESNKELQICRWEK